MPGYAVTVITNDGSGSKCLTASAYSAENAINDFQLSGFNN